MIKMSNELIVIEQSTALQVLSNKEGVKSLIDQVRENVMSLEGGEMESITGRKQIRSNAFKATKSKAAVKKMIFNLIAAQELKMAPYIAVVGALKDNYNEFASGMDSIRKEANADVDAYEAELKRIEDEKTEIARRAEIDSHRDFAQMMMNEYFSLVERGDFEVAYIEKVAAEKVEQERIAREKAIAEKAAAEAKLKAEAEAEVKAKAEAERVAIEKQQAIALAEKEKQDAIDAKLKAEQEAEAQRQAAMQAEFELEQAAEQAIIDAQEAEKVRVEQQAEAEMQAKIAEQRRIDQQKQSDENARIAEQNKIAEQKAAKEKADAERKKAVEQARVNEVNRQAAEKARVDEVAATRAANTKHRASIKTASKESLMKQAGLTEEQAIAVVKALCCKAGIANITINF